MFRAVADLEAAGKPGYLHNVAREARMDLQDTRRVLHSLFQEVGLVHELQVTEPDRGQSTEFSSGPEF